MFLQHSYPSLTESRALVLHEKFETSESAIDVETGGVAEVICHVNCMLGRGTAVQMERATSHWTAVACP